jgi:hypothetical protein
MLERGIQRLREAHAELGRRLDLLETGAAALGGPKTAVQRQALAAAGRGLEDAAFQVREAAQACEPAAACLSRVLQAGAPSARPWKAAEYGVL